MTKKQPSSERTPPPAPREEQGQTQDCKHMAVWWIAALNGWQCAGGQEKEP